ncbi:serine/threonine-protein kinase mos-like [Oratosquilla oratoria]|uniref:serine/threonine-protein kinase mos-like n=1 Tax=Oratosquilla oratoria TaxID=337810 RepID=UPI003F76DB8C
MDIGHNKTTAVISCFLREEARKLGEGRFGIAYAGEIDGRTVCFKVFKGESVWKRMTKEADLLKKLAEVPGVPRALDYCSSPVTLITTYEGPTTLEAKVFETPVPLTRNQLLDIFLQVASTLEGLHKCGVAHNDLKGDNVVLRFEGDRYIATTIDLGNATHLGQRPYNSVNLKVSSHIAPELAQGLPASTKSDVYSLGSLMAWVTERVPDLKNDFDLGFLIETAMQEDPQDRIAVWALAERLSNLISGFSNPHLESDSEEEDTFSFPSPLPSRGKKRPRSSSDSCSIPPEKRMRLAL